MLCSLPVAVLGLLGPAVTVAAQDKNGVNNLHKASIGRFKVAIHDSRLPLDDAMKNQTTLMPDLEDLFYAVFDYLDTDAFNETGTPSDSDQIQKIDDLAREKLANVKDGYDNYGSILMNASQQDAQVQANDSSLDSEKWLQSLTVSYLSAVWNMSYQTSYYIQGAYIGVGANSECAEQIDQVLSNKSEFEKMGSSAATTLLALIPAFLAFGNLYVPRSSEAFATSALVGLTTAFYTLGLPVSSMSAVKQSNAHVLSSFGIVTLALIGSLGKQNKDGSAKRGESLESLRGWSSAHHGDEIKARFMSIKDLVNNWEKRWHLWHAPALFIAAAQVIIFALAIFPLFQYLGVPKFIFACYGDSRVADWTGLYLGVSAGTNSIIRFLSWENSDHERVKVFALSKSAKEFLADIIMNSDVGETTATHVPPLHPPYLIALHSFLRRIFRRAPPPAYSNQPAGPGFISSTIQSAKHRFAFFSQRRNFVDMLKAGFIGRTRSARRWRPVFILVHLSSEGRNPLWILFTGFIEAALLLVLTFFFAAQWGGNLVITMYALVLLLVFITLGRALGFIYVWLSSQVWGLTVIDCDSVTEIRGVLRIICSMEGVLTIVNGATYFGGYRMDGRGRFLEFLERYERGDFDELPVPEEVSADVAFQRATEAEIRHEAKLNDTSAVSSVQL